MISDRLARDYRKMMVEALTDDPDAVHPDSLPDFLERFAESVYTLDWDSGAPGAGAGTERVYRLGRWYLTGSVDFGWDGPFESLDEALGGTVFVTGATREISCVEWSEEEILDRIQLHGEPDAVVIQGTRWPFETLEHRVRERDAGR